MRSSKLLRDDIGIRAKSSLHSYNKVKNKKELVYKNGFDGRHDSAVELRAAADRFANCNGHN